MSIILCLLGMTGSAVVTELDGEGDQPAGVLGKPDAVGVLVECHLPVGGGVVQLAGVLVPVHLGLGTVQGPGEWCRSGMASRRERCNAGHTEFISGTGFSVLAFFLVSSFSVPRLGSRPSWQLFQPHLQPDPRPLS